MLLQWARKNYFSKGLCYCNAYVFYVKPQLMYWDFAIIIYIPLETECKVQQSTVRVLLVCTLPPCFVRTCLQALLFRSLDKD